MQRNNATSSVLLAAIVAVGLAGCMDPFSYGTRAGGEEVPDVVSFDTDVYPILLSYCSACHAEGGTASGSGLVFSNDAATDYDMVVSFVTVGNPDASALLLKGAGATAHGGSGIISSTSIEYGILAAWVEQGAAQ